MVLEFEITSRENFPTAYICMHRFVRHVSDTVTFLFRIPHQLPDIKVTYDKIINCFFLKSVSVPKQLGGIAIFLFAE